MYGHSGGNYELLQKQYMLGYQNYIQEKQGVQFFANNCRHRHCVQTCFKTYFICKITWRQFHKNDLAKRTNLCEAISPLTQHTAFILDTTLCTGTDQWLHPRFLSEVPYIDGMNLNPERRWPKLFLRNIRPKRNGNTDLAEVGTPFYGIQ